MNALPCPVQAECGGCALMPLSLSEQRAQKLAQLARALAANEMEAPAPSFCDSPQPLGYRNRIRLRVEPTGTIRFFNQHKQPSCAVLEPELRDRLRGLLTLSRSQPELFRPFLHLELRSDDDLGRAALAVSGPTLAFRDLLEPARKLEGALNDALVGVRGDPVIARQQRTIIGRVFTHVPLDGFWQINTRVNELLVAAVRDGARSRGAQSALDLYSGAGNFSLPLAAAGISVDAVEVHEPAARALADAATEQGLFIKSHAEAAEHAGARLHAERRTFQLVLIDAPRRGAQEALSSVARLGPRWIAVCSCNPETLARDLSRLRSQGYRLEELRCFDMFPHTRHLEVLAWLERS